MAYRMLSSAGYRYIAQVFRYFRLAHTTTILAHNGTFDFLRTSTFKVLDKPWSQVSSLLSPLVLAFDF